MRLLEIDTGHEKMCRMESAPLHYGRALQRVIKCPVLESRAEAIYRVVKHKRLREDQDRMEPRSLNQRVNEREKVLRGSWR